MSVWGGEAIHDAVLSQIASAPTGKKIASYAFTWNGDGTVSQIIAYDINNIVLFTLSFSYSGGNAISIVRS